MSFYFRDKPRFGERLRGKSGDELLQELKQKFDEDSKGFFEPATTRGSSRDREPFEQHAAGFPRGFPFDDDGFGRRGDIRSHLDDLAARHPEFADHLLGPPWGETPFHGTLRNRRRGSGTGSYQSHPDEDARSQASGSSAASAASGASGVSSHGDPEGQSVQDHNQPQPESRRNPIPQYGLRNTVDIGQHRHNMENPDKMNRGQRSMSAPPENRQAQYQQQQQQQQQQPQFQSPQQPLQSPHQRFVSRVDITPQAQQQQGESSKPPMSPKQQQVPQAQQPQAQQKPQQRPGQQGNVRHIPIFVEGRDEPVVPRDVVDEPAAFSQQPQSPPQFQTPPQFQRPSHFNQQQFGNKPQQWPPHFQQQFYQQQPQYEQQSQTQRPQQQPNHYQQQQQQYRQQQAEKPRAQQQYAEQSAPQEETEPHRPKQVQPKDPLERVALVQQEVDSLKGEVMKFTGNSRQAKEYMYLDEMLTRELIKLDDIETEGKENVRQARKNTIKSIQNCIGLLESMVPLPGQQREATEEEKKSQSMETETEPETVAANGAPIPLPPAPSSPTKDVTENAVAAGEPPAQDEQYRTVQPVQEPMTTDNESLSKSASVTAMEVQQPAAEATDGPRKQPEPVGKQNEPAEARNMEAEMPKAPKSPKKGKKTKKQTPVSEEAIPLPAPEAPSK